MSNEMILGLLALPLVIIGFIRICFYCYELGQESVLDAMREHERLEVAQYMNSGRFDKEFSKEQIAEMETMDVTEFHKLILTAARNQYQPFTS